MTEIHSTVSDAHQTALEAVMDAVRAYETLCDKAVDMHPGWGADRQHGRAARLLAIHKALWLLVDATVAAAQGVMYSQDDMDDAHLAHIKAENLLRDALEAATGSRLAPYEGCLSIDQEEMEFLYDPDHLDDDQGEGT